MLTFPVFTPFPFCLGQTLFATHFWVVVTLAISVLDWVLTCVIAKKSFHLMADQLALDHSSSILRLWLMLRPDVSLVVVLSILAVSSTMASAWWILLDLAV